METNYLILGASHAGLSALEAIRRYDRDTGLTIVTAETDHLYSPTALPYLISGRTGKGFMDIRGDAYFKAQNADLIKGVRAAALDTEKSRVALDNGDGIQYDKLLIATGASAWVPPIPGMEDVNYFCVRTLADAVAIRECMGHAKSAVIIGAGFIGMHAAENLANKGISVVIVEARDQVMPASFDRDASQCIETVFRDKGITILTGIQAQSVRRQGDLSVLSLSNNEEVPADMMIVAAGIAPNTGFLEGSPIDQDQGVIVDARMRTSVPNIWAAGDVARAPGFFSGEKAVGGTVPTAGEQGKTAGMDMARDAHAADYPGNLNMNAFGFFDNFAFSIGNITEDDRDARAEVHSSQDPSGNSFLKLVFRDNALTGVSAINRRLDPGILKQLIFNRTDLSSRKAAFIKAPLEVGRQLMRESL